jgi:pimeloyl-ACP methyl ester carboxylesterase
VQSPATIVLAHGAGSGPEVYAAWPPLFRGARLVAVDLHDGLDLARASHDDYAAKVVEAAAANPSPVALCGWSMGGLVVLQAAERARPHAVVLLEPSPPAEVQGAHPEIEVQDGLFDPEEAYGRFPEGFAPRPESLRARAERKRGLSVASLGCPSLVVYGDAFPVERGMCIAELYGSDTRVFPGLDHWDLVLAPQAAAAVAAWLGIGPR